MTKHQIRTLSDLATRAAAALIPLAADGEGRDSHGGKLASPAATLARGIDALIQAGRMAAQLRASASQACESPNA